MNKDTKEKHYYQVYINKNIASGIESTTELLNNNNSFFFNGLLGQVISSSSSFSSFFNLFSSFFSLFHHTRISLNCNLCGSIIHLLKGLSA